MNFEDRDHDARFETGRISSDNPGFASLFAGD